MSDGREVLKVLLDLDMTILNQIDVRLNLTGDG